MQTLYQLYLANAKEFVRDRMAIFWTLAFPIIFILIFGLIFSGGSNTVFDVGLAVEDSGTLSTNLRQAFNSVPAFDIREAEREDLLTALQEGDLRAVIVIPAGLSTALDAESPTTVEVFYDATNQTSAQIVLTIVERVIESFDRRLSDRPVLLSVARNSISSERLGQIDFLLPGILAMSLMQLGVLGTAPQLVQLREQQVLRRMGATPLPRSTLLAAQVLYRLTISVVQTVVILVVGSLLFNVTVLGNWGLLIVFVFLGALLFVAIGYLISGLAKTQESVNGLAQLIYLPMIMLSGVFIPIEVMPQWIRPVIVVLPLTYLADALRQIMVDSPPEFALSLDFGLLVGWLVVSSILAVRFFRWE